MSKDQRNVMMDVLRLAYSQNSDLAGEDNNGVRVTIYNHELLDVINQIKQFRLKPNHESIRAYLETKRGDRQAIPIDITPNQSRRDGKWKFAFQDPTSMKEWLKRNHNTTEDGQPQNTDDVIDAWMKSWADLINKQNQ